MSDLLSRCANVSLNVNLPTFSCTDDIMGNLGNLTDFGRGLGSIPAQLGGIVDCVAEGLQQQIAQAIDNLLSTLRRIMGALNFSLPDPLFSTIQLPEFEFDLRMRALWNEFKLYLHEKLIDLLSKIPGLSFILNLLKVPIPFLSGVYLTDVFTAEGRARIFAAIQAQLARVQAALGLPWNLEFTGELTLKMPDFNIVNIINRIFSEIQKALSNIIWTALTAITKITKPIEKIWQLLGFPLLPTFTVPSFAEIFNAIWTRISNLGLSIVERMQAAITALLNFNLKDILTRAFGAILSRIPWPFPWKIGDILKLTGFNWNLTLPEIDFSRITQAVQDLLNRIPTLIFELWMQLVKPFFKAIEKLLAGITELLKYIPFTFCSFINLAAKPVLSLATNVRSIIPANITITTFNPPIPTG